MSVTIMARVFWTDIPDMKYKEIGVDGKSAKLAMLAIADNADDFGENSWQSFETLAKKTGLKRRSVIRVIHALLENGYCRLSGVSRYGTNDYAVNIDKLGNPPLKRARVGRPETSDSDALIGDSVTEISDPRSPESSLPTPKTPLLTPQSLAQANAKVTAIVTGSLGPKAIQDAMAKFFKLTPRWEGNKFNREWMQWAIEEGITPEQIEKAADKWRSDTKFNWAQPSLKLIQERWLMLTETDPLKEKGHWL